MSEPDKATLIAELLEKLKLPKSYLETVELWLEPIAKEIAASIARTRDSSNAPRKSKNNRTFILGVQGAQGSGKSTCSEFLKALFESEYQLSTAVLSLDDFYLTRQERQTLAQSTHAMLATRGVPGTHDVGLAIETINNLCRAENNATIAIPRFNKAIDDRAAIDEWDSIEGPVDIVILEGWFTGIEAQDPERLAAPINALEEAQDPEGIWRTYVNNALLGEYQTLFNRLDKLIVLKAPSFDCVYQWRLKQEQKLIASLSDRDNSGDIKTLSPEQVKQFIAYFQRLTEHALDSLPAKADWCLEQNSEQKIVHQLRKQDTPSHMIITDLDGTLLDHHTYSWEAATPAMLDAEQRGIPIIINTSKTYPEVVQLQKQLGIFAPFIVENGSALYIPLGFYSKKQEATLLTNGSQVDNYIEVLFGAKRSDIQALVYGLREQYHYDFAGYKDWTVEQLAEITGLDSVSASYSQQRHYSEPLIWSDSDADFDRFSRAVDEAGFKILRGGRFIHVLGQTDKAKPMRFLMSEIYQGNTQSICLGDSHNDVDMLNAADIAVCVKSPTGPYPTLNQSCYQTVGLGPIGWNEALSKILSN